MRYYTDYELSQLELLPWFWIVEGLILNFDGDGPHFLDEGNAT